MKKTLLAIVLAIAVTSTCMCAYAAEIAEESNTVSVSFNLNYEEATEHPVIMTFEVGEPVVTMSFEKMNEGPKNNYVSRQGWTFTGWFTDPECTDPFELGTSAAEDLDLYAGWQEWDEDSLELDKKVQEELVFTKEIYNHKTAFTQESYEAYMALAEPLYYVDTTVAMTTPVFPDMAGMVDIAAMLRQGLEYKEGITDMTDVEWKIWGETVPQTGDVETYNWYKAYDNEGFEPYLEPYVLEDQSQVKGNLIVIAGGGHYQRANTHEAYNVAERFNELGYNCFVLQRRVVPYYPTDTYLDTQRAIRYLKFHAEEYGLAKMENLAAVGFSGGGAAILGAVCDFYGDIQPTVVDPNYVCDEVDAMNADLSAALLVYSARPIETDNPNVPPVFVVWGADDSLYDPEIDLASIQSYKEHGIYFEEHIFPMVGHSFGSGFKGLDMVTTKYVTYTNTTPWTGLADTFMQLIYGEIEEIIPIE